MADDLTDEMTRSRSRTGDDAADNAEVRTVMARTDERIPIGSDLDRPLRSPYDEFFDYETMDERDFVRVPKSTSGARRFLLWLAVFALIIVVGIGGTALWVVRQVDPGGDPGPELAISIPEGSSVVNIADILETGEIVTNGRIFREYLRVRAPGPYQAGEYVFAQRSSMSEAAAVLEGGPVPPDYLDVTVPEGLKLTEIATRLNSEVPHFSSTSVTAALGSLAVRSKYQPEDSTNLEGLLFPDTYRAATDETETQFLARMVEQMESVAGQLGYDQAAEITGYTPYELIIIASMIEREARLPEDQGKISRVIHNRLAEGMKLEIDATVLYALGEHTDELTSTDLEIDSPYNTRRYGGLPPTPIGAPGRGALAAAMSPDEGDWLFYVLATEEGGHFFTSSYDEFLQQKNESKERGLF